jgi:hypothetical protein
MKLVRLTKMCLNETYHKVCIGKNLLDTFHIQNGLREGDALLSLPFNFSLEYVIRNIKENQEGLNGAHQLLVYANDVRKTQKLCYRLAERLCLAKKYRIKSQFTDC